jgi:FixJ family two-component response regulator
MVARFLRVAILDDDPSVRTAIKRLLDVSGMIADTFTTSVELFNAMETASPDCILVDLYMPTLGGLEVLNYLRVTGINVPVIVMTAHDDPAARVSCLKAGAIAYLRKPIEGAELLDTIIRSAKSTII